MRSQTTYGSGGEKMVQVRQGIPSRIEEVCSPRIFSQDEDGLPTLPVAFFQQKSRSSSRVKSWLCSLCFGIEQQQLLKSLSATGLDMGAIGQEAHYRCF